MSRSYSLPTVKTLFAQASSCAYPDCDRPLIFEDRGLNTVIAEIAHIRSGRRDGPRHDPQFTGPIDGPDNLLLLCAIHHHPVDHHESAYPIAELESWKNEQTASARGGTQISDIDARAFVGLSPEERTAITNIARLAERVMSTGETALLAVEEQQRAREDAIREMRARQWPIWGVMEDGTEVDLSRTVQPSKVEEDGWRTKLEDALAPLRPSVQAAAQALREEVAVLRMMSPELRHAAEGVRVAALQVPAYLDNTEGFRQSVAAMGMAVEHLWSRANGSG